MATQTWILDTAGMTYVDKDKLRHTINTNEQLKLTFTDSGTGGTFVGLEGAGPITCTDGFEFTLECDKHFVMESSVDGTSVGQKNGELCFVEENFVRHPFRIGSLAMTNADGVATNNVGSITFESILHGETMTWTNINTS